MHFQMNRRCSTLVIILSLLLHFALSFPLEFPEYTDILPQDMEDRKYTHTFLVNLFLFATHYLKMFIRIFCSPEFYSTRLKTENARLEKHKISALRKYIIFTLILVLKIKFIILTGNSNPNLK